jgi:hypothetical protein
MRICHDLSRKGNAREQEASALFHGRPWQFFPGPGIFIAIPAQLKIKISMKSLRIAGMVSITSIPRYISMPINLSVLKR